MERRWLSPPCPAAIYDNAADVFTCSVAAFAPCVRPEVGSRHHLVCCGDLYHDDTVDKLGSLFPVPVDLHYRM